MAKIVYGKRNTATVDSIYDYGSITENMEIYYGENRLWKKRYKNCCINW